MSQKLTIIEDELAIVNVYQKVLGPHYELALVHDIDAAFKLLSKQPCDLIIADLCLPDGNFTEIHQVEAWRPLIARQPMVAVSALDDLDTLNSCLSTWASDYLVKPFNNNELISKCRNLIARHQGLRLDPLKLTLCLGDQASEELTAMEFKILSFLISQPDYRCPQVDLLLAAWGQSKGMQRLHMALTRTRTKIQSLGVQIVTDANGIVALHCPPKGGAA